MDMFKSVALFLAAGLAEIAGGYLVWLWIRRDGFGLSYGLFGALILVAYGLIPTLQPFPRFGRIYATYGGFFILLSLLWGWGLDGHRPDRYDVLGALFCLAGVALMMYWPRPS